ncbi:Glycosyl hydrolase [Acidisarcina polymorpha]|uniref:Glycosyl hydrolase n=1 Tax=Acidisarcina polymorpha TaxID=2211140 RepID=A0A2Z5G7K7_9BACT|nr:hypothetical protein [Acidisarcina polymorpha]AXC14959.1 Glycosyl hydrolase [Acidisarcina polymorpha]
MKPAAERTLQLFLAFVLFVNAAVAQPPTTSPTSPWELQNSTTKASLRGIHAAGGGVAWASGTNGTILRTEDGGYMWQSCAMPPGAEKLDFRGIWAWDANTAVVMSSGFGDLSRLYKTTNGCSSWTLLYTNPDKDGFWDAMAFSDREHGFLFGDPVDGRYFVAFTSNGGAAWSRIDSGDLKPATANSGGFAASNSSLALAGPILGPVNAPWFGTSGPGGAYVYSGGIDCGMGMAHEHPEECLKHWEFDRTAVPLVGESVTEGVFAVGVRYGETGVWGAVVVGGNYKKPNEEQQTAAFWHDGDKTWTAASIPPHGYRSALAWDEAEKAWIAAGINGSDVSYDDGKTWQSLDTGNWNALSLPWVVGPEGRIAKLVSLKSAGVANK